MPDNASELAGLLKKSRRWGSEKVRIGDRDSGL
jgi:hypothetical protein